MPKFRPPINLNKCRSYTQLITEDMPIDIKQFLNTAKDFFKLIRTENGGIYVGEMVSKKKNGTGFMRYPNHSYFFG